MSRFRSQYAKPNFLRLGVFVCVLWLANRLPVEAIAAQESTVPAPTPQTVPAAYQVETDDVLEITVIGQTELTKTVTVLPDGTISYPYIGEFHVVGFTLSHIKKLISATLKDYIAVPQVTVAVVKRAEKVASVVGPVKTPGPVDIRDGWRLLDLIAAAGGLTTRPEWVNAILVRSSTGASIPVDLVRLYVDATPLINIPVVAGDKLILTEKDPATLQVQVVGEVTKPGAVMLPDNGSIVAVLNAAGGPTLEAALTKASILRGDQIIPINLVGYADSGKVPDNIRLQPGDTLVIPKNRRLFAVIGLVRDPGVKGYPEQGDLDVLGAITVAGGIVTGGGVEPDLKNASIVRSVPTATDPNAPKNATGVPVKDTNQLTYERVDLSQLLKNGKSSNNRILHPGDILYVPSKRSPTTLGLRDALAVTPLISLLLR